jgi:hypothetical protein
VFTYLEQNEAVEKARCYLYDNCIIIKLRVSLPLFRKQEKTKLSESSFLSTSSSNSSGKRMRKRNWENRSASNSRSSRVL